MSPKFELDPGSPGKLPVVETQLESPKSSLKEVWGNTNGEYNRGCVV